MAPSPAGHKRGLEPSTSRPCGRGSRPNRLRPRPLRAAPGAGGVMARPSVPAPRRAARCPPLVTRAGRDAATAPSGGSPRARCARPRTPYARPVVTKPVATASALRSQRLYGNINEIIGPQRGSHWYCWPNSASRGQAVESQPRIGGRTDLGFESNDHAAGVACTPPAPVSPPPAPAQPPRRPAHQAWQVTAGV